jgi:hypothetical protein
MNTARFEELLLAYEDDALTPEELAEFKQLLASSPHARQRLVEAGVMQSIAASHVMSAPIIEIPQRNSSRWQQWRPLTAAAAGLVLGCFSTSLVWAINTPSWADGIRRMLLPLGNPGFEQQEPLPQVHLVPQAAQWSGLDTEIVEGGGERPLAKEGRRMIRLGPAPEGKGYFANVMADLPANRPQTDKPLQIEVTASYHASKAGQGEHYSLTAATFAETADIVSTHWENTWADMRDASLTSTGKAIFPTAVESGWQTITLRLDVPAQARTLVISMGSNTPGPIAGRTDHFMDDVHAAWVISRKAPLP